jgi:hypothetical protein
MEPGPNEKRLARNGWGIEWSAPWDDLPGGYWAYKGSVLSPELETGIFNGPEEAAAVALETWPDEFPNA